MLVPLLLTDDHREKRLEVCQELLDDENGKERFPRNITTGDETWIYD